MRLRELLAASDLARAGVTVEAVVGDAEVEVSDIVLDSRQVTPGALFACVPGQRMDGHFFAAPAVSDGASALLTDRVLDLPVAQLVVSAVRPALGLLADAFWRQPSSELAVIGVTGTSGKTTTCSFLQAILAAHGWPAAMVGTLTGTRTTPEAPELQRRLAELRDEGVRAVAMEVSSHALDQHRVDGTRFAAAVFTNLTPEHLDYHETMERYFEAKARLFRPGWAAAVVVNGDDAWGQQLLASLAGEDRPVVAFGIADAGGLALGPGGSSWTWRGHRMAIHLPGRFNVLNALAAATAAEVLGIGCEAVAAGLESVDRVRGRFEAVEAGQDFTVLVDYAHKPDALEQALRTARELTSGRLIVVFGAGGDRDRSKRPLMGEAGARLADVVVLTSDNPRSEEPGQILDEVAAGAVGPAAVHIESDRARAIALALRMAGPGDLVLVAGKGHETYQEIDGRRVEFDDAEVATEILQRLAADGPAGGSRA